jgi:DNA-directed RNA polymerase subunit RPC12/RpoP
MSERRPKTCSSCETKYTIEWDIEVQDLEPLTCPFCGHEVGDIEEEEIWSNEEDNDSWD